MFVAYHQHGGEVEASYSWAWLYRSALAAGVSWWWLLLLLFLLVIIFWLALTL